MVLADRVIGVNRFLTAVYEHDMRLSTLLASLGYTPSHIAALRAHHLEQVVQSFVDAIAARLHGYADGPRKYHVLARRYGLDGAPAATLATLGAELGISRERVRQIEGAALRRCRSIKSRRQVEGALHQAAQRLLGDASITLLPGVGALAAAQAGTPPTPDGPMQPEMPAARCISVDDIPYGIAATTRAVLRVTGEDITDSVLAHLLGGAVRPIVLALVGHYQLQFAHGAFAGIEHRRLKALVGQVRRVNAADAEPLPDDPDAAPEMPPIDIISRVRGCLIGQLAGDALGSMVEFQDGVTIARRYPGDLRTIGPSPVWSSMAGQPTDDSELALALGRTLVQTTQFDVEAVARAYVDWLESSPFDVGGTTRAALATMRRARDTGGNLSAAAQAGANYQSEANGALMRQSPLAIWGHQLDPELLDQIVRVDTRLTHPNSVCQDASAAFVVAVAAAIRSGLDAPAAHAYALEWACAHDASPSVIEALRAARTGPPIGYSRHSSGHVIVALQNAFYQALHAPTFEAGVVNTVMQGGDTDTNGAIAGALLGAIHGIDAIPAQWREAVLACRPERGAPGVQQPRPRRYWPDDALEVAGALLEAGRQAALAAGNRHDADEQASLTVRPDEEIGFLEVPRIAAAIMHAIDDLAAVDSRPVLRRALFLALDACHGPRENAVVARASVSAAVASVARAPDSWIASAIRALADDQQEDAATALYHILDDERAEQLREAVARGYLSNRRHAWPG